MRDRILGHLLLKRRESLPLVGGVRVIKDRHQHVRIDDHDHGVGDLEFPLDLRLKLQLKLGERVAAECERAEGKESVFLHRLRSEIHLTAWSAQCSADDRQLNGTSYHDGAWSPYAQFFLRPSARASTPRVTAALTLCTRSPCGRRSTSRAAGASTPSSSPCIAVRARRCPASRASCASSPPFPQSPWCHGTIARRRRRYCAWARPVFAVPSTALSPMAGDGCEISWGIRPRLLQPASSRDSSPRSANRRTKRGCSSKRWRGWRRRSAPCAAWLAISACGPAR